MEKLKKMHLSTMIKLVILFNLFPFQIFSQDSIVSDKTLTFDIQGSCDKNFSEIKLDSTFTNFYIINYKDTIFFKDNTCMISRQTTSPTTFITRVKGGYAEGFLRIFTSSDLFYSILDANFSNGQLIDGNSFEYYNSGKIKLTGQYLGGRPFGTWTTYYESGQVQRIVTYDQREYIKLIEYEENGVVIENYDYFEEKAKYK